MLSALVAIETQERQDARHRQERACSVAVWINDGLNIEEDQYVCFVTSINKTYQLLGDI
jgi:hypothetical protein